MSNNIFQPSEINMVLTGDTHGNFRRLVEFQNEYKIARAMDLVVTVLGDFCANYFGDERDNHAKDYLSKNTKYTIFVVHGNHERNPEYMGIKEKTWKGGTVFYEEEYPNILYAKDGEIYDFDGKKVIVLGGAYSVDKDYRLMMGYRWVADEQMSEDVRIRCEDNLRRAGWKVDYVLSHTVPLSVEPTEFFISGIDQSTVDKTTETWMEEIRKKLDYKQWFAGHYHCSVSKPGNISIMYYEMKELKKDGTVNELCNFGH
jgi:3-oxoacid CoA-transferase subunit A